MCKYAMLDSRNPLLRPSFLLKDPGGKFSRGMMVVVAVLTFRSGTFHIMEEYCSTQYLQVCTFNGSQAFCSAKDSQNMVEIMNNICFCVPFPCLFDCWHEYSGGLVSGSPIISHIY